jgi:hypothetical protein
MKPIGASHSRTFLASWQTKRNGKDALLHHLRDMTRALEALQIEMHGQLAASAPGQHSPHFLADANAVQALNNFKAELDQVRRILWFYIEEAAQPPAPDGDYTQQVKHSQRLNSILTPVSPAPDTDEAIAGGAPESFFKRLDVVIDNYYLQEKRPVANTKSGKPMGF